MTDIERYIVEQIELAEYLDEELKMQWIARIQKDGLTPATTRLLLQSMLDQALVKIGESLDPSDPSSQERYQKILSEIDRAEQEFQKRLDS
ncbi:MAG: hypothetical protein Q7S47_02820 [bacterium]|nr:hypothetical protein [bacterium]